MTTEEIKGCIAQDCADYTELIARRLMSDCEDCKKRDAEIERLTEKLVGANANLAVALGDVKDLQARLDALQARFDALEKQEPVGWFKYDKVSLCWHPQHEEYASTVGKVQEWKQLFAAPVVIAAQEPVAWVNSSDLISAEIDRKRYPGGHGDQYTWRGFKNDYGNTPLFAAPVAQPTIDLSRLQPWVSGLGKAILRELQATQPAEPVESLSREKVKEILRESGYDTASAQERADFINGIRHGEVAHDIIGAAAKGKS